VEAHLIEIDKGAGLAPHDGTHAAEGSLIEMLAPVKRDVKPEHERIVLRNPEYVR
jgi:hypothetical protein